MHLIVSLLVSTVCWSAGEGGFGTLLEQRQLLLATCRQAAVGNFVSESA